MSLLGIGSSSGGGTKSPSVLPDPSQASQTSLPPPKHCWHLVSTIPRPLHKSHSTDPVPEGAGSFPVPLHSSHLAGNSPVPLHLEQSTSPSPSHVTHFKCKCPIRLLYFKTREDSVMPKTSIEDVVTPVYYLAYFLSMRLKESAGSDVAQTHALLSLSPTIICSCSLPFCLVEAVFHIRPVDDVPPFVDVGASIVLILQIVRVFPYV